MAVEDEEEAALFEGLDEPKRSWKVLLSPPPPVVFVPWGDPGLSLVVVVEGGGFADDAGDVAVVVAAAGGDIALAISRGGGAQTG